MPLPLLVGFGIIFFVVVIGWEVVVVNLRGGYLLGGIGVGVVTAIVVGGVALVVVGGAEGLGVV